MQSNRRSLSLYAASLGAATAVLTLLAVGQSIPRATEEYGEIVVAMKNERHADGWLAYRADAERLQRMLNGSPRSWLEIARADFHLGNSERSLASVANYVAMQQSLAGVLDSDEFKPLRQLPAFAALEKKSLRNESAILLGKLAFSLSERDFVAEDIDYDHKTKRFFLSSIGKKKAISVDAIGTARDFVLAPHGWPMMALKIDSRRRLLWVTEVAPKGFAIVPRADWGKSVVLCYSLDDSPTKLLQQLDGPPGTELGDMVLLPNGDPLLSDSQGGGVYQLHRTTNQLERIDDGSFLSPQTPALRPDGKHVFIPDYLRGVGVLDLATKHVQWFSMQKRFALSGIDGIYFRGGSLIATQNGTTPERVVRFQLDSSLARIVSSCDIERGTRNLGDPTHGVVIGNEFYYIANSGWDTLADDGSPKPDAQQTAVRIMHSRLDLPC